VDPSSGGKMQKIYLLSDLHGNIPAYEAVVNDIGYEAYNKNKKLFVGDYIDFGPWPNEIIDSIKSLRNAYYVIGNHDQYLFQDIKKLLPKSDIKQNMIEHAYWTKSNISNMNIEWIKSLEIVKSIMVEGIEILFFHGNLYETDKAISEDTIRSIKHKIVISGHIHHAYSKIIDDKIVVNPGSVGEPLDKDTRASYSILNIESGIIKVENKRVEYDISIIEKELISKNVPWKDEIIRGFKEACLRN